MTTKLTADEAAAYAVVAALRRERAKRRVRVKRSDNNPNPELNATLLLAIKFIEGRWPNIKGEEK